LVIIFIYQNDELSGLGVGGMSKKVVLGGIFVVLMLIAISLSTTVSSNATYMEKKESPLWRIRNRQAIGEKIGRIFENIKASFVGESRIAFDNFFKNIRQRNEMFSVALTVFTCPALCCK